MYKIRYARKFILQALLCVAAFLGLGGCVGASLPDPPVCGGVTDKTDHSAPKTISSGQIAAFHAHFFLQGEWLPAEKGQFYTFDIEKDSSGVLMASSASPAISFPADAGLLAKLQAIIAEHNLAADNGIYRTTAGLPPAYQPCRFKAVYASGEVLQFTKNNDPDAQWARQTYLLFANWFAEKGNASLLPQQDPGPEEEPSL